jgi:hypothetical protein
MYKIEHDEIINFDADFNENFDDELINKIAKCKKIFFLNTKGFGIKSVYLESKFNQSVDNLPNSLTHIKFGYNFNKSVDNLPLMIVWLEFDKCFNQYVDILPNNLKYLVFGDDFNKPVDNLPNSLEYLSFGKCFNQQINSLPNTIVYIGIGNHKDNQCDFNQKVLFLPLNLNNLVFCVKKQKYPIKYDFIKQINKLIDK